LKKKKGFNKKQGLKYYRKKQFVQAVSCLEKALRETKDDYEVYLFLGFASLFTGDIDGARRYFKGGLLINENETELLKGLAYIYLKDERIEDAISLWGEVLEKTPRDKMIKRALQELRESKNISQFSEDARPKDFLSAKPPLYIKMRPYLLGISISIGIILIGIIFYTTPLYRKALEKFYPEISKLNQITFPEDVQIVQEAADDALYSFSEKDIETNFTRIKKYIYKNKVNMAIVALNRVGLSNASPAVKERFEILYSFINPPDPLSIDYNPRLYEILKEPAAFRGVYVSWTGRISGLQKEKKFAEFDLLVHYENEDTIEGIAHIVIHGTFYIENKQMVEVFGSYEGYDRETGKLLINGILLRDLGL
jgi:tetratricopeptide (TPR) repeat protein